MTHLDAYVNGDSSILGVDATLVMKIFLTVGRLKPHKVEPIAQTVVYHRVPQQHRSNICIGITLALRSLGDLTVSDSAR